jgi:TPR repeat protein
MLPVLCVLSGCASTDNNDSSTKVIDYNAEFNQLITQFRKSPKSVTYNQLWHVYLKSDQISNSGVKQNEYMQLIRKLEDNELSCADINWKDLTHQNFWSIKPHISAETCFETLGDKEQASFHASVIEFILSGILSNGDGNNYYSAYEIATWGDASDVIELSGYEIIDSYLELKHYGQALYFIYVVDDPETGFQKEIYFENNKFLHEVMNIQYPFASLDDQLKIGVVDLFSTSDTNAKIAKAKNLISERKYDDAVNMYLSAINDGSAIANYFLGVLCHSKKQSILPQSECASYLFQAAEMGYMNASIALAFAYKEGVEVEQNDQVFADIMSSVEGRFEPGEAWLILATFYNNILGIKDDVKHQEYLNKAAALGNQKAEFASIMIDINNADDKDKKQIEIIISRLKTVANKGLDTAQATYAQILLSQNKKGSEKWNEAKLWIDESAAQGNPFANYLSGNAYQFDYFSENDLLKAYLAYNEAALDYYPRAQLEVGYFNDIGRVVETDKRLAMSWYVLCAKALNLDCMRNLGIYFENGIVVEKNYEVAFNYYQLASTRGHAKSTTNLALMHWFGNGIEKDIDKANQLFKNSCDMADGEGCMNLGNHYRTGEAEGFKQDHVRANELFNKACDYGYMGGCNNLANSHENALGVSLNYIRASELYKYACDNDNAMSCSNLGYMYKQGNGVEKNKSKAKELYLKACIGGYEIGCSNYRNQ